MWVRSLTARGRTPGIKGPALALVKLVRDPSLPGRDGIKVPRRSKMQASWLPSLAASIRPCARTSSLAHVALRVKTIFHMRSEPLEPPRDRGWDEAPFSREACLLSPP